MDFLAGVEDPRCRTPRDRSFRHFQLFNFTQASRDCSQRNFSQDRKNQQPPNQSSNSNPRNTGGISSALHILLQRAQTKHTAPILTPKHCSSLCTRDSSDTKHPGDSSWRGASSVCVSAPMESRVLLVRTQMFLCILLKYFLLLKGTYSGSVNKTD